MPRLTLFKKIMIITLLLSLLPLLASSLILFLNLEAIKSHLSTEIAETANLQASESLKMRAEHVAETISDFLHQCESDLMFLSASPLDRATLLNFYSHRRGEVWERSGSATGPKETKQLIPLYRSIAVIDASGRERMVIRDGRLLEESELRDVSNPANTEFKSEDYFYRVRSLKPGKIYVSHLTGFHITKNEQLAGASEPEKAFGGARYKGVIRFGVPLFDANGSLKGMVVLALDHRHLMEFTQHIEPGRNFSTVFPSYKSGNYAFVFDDEGWIITHPKYWDIRGLDREGRLVPPYSTRSSRADIDSGRIPFSLDHAGFIHSNYPKVAAEIRNRRSGHMDVTNVGGAAKVMAYAPIVYSTGDYGKHGIFGGVTISFQSDQFHDAARKSSGLINDQLSNHATRSAIILMLTALLAAISAWALSRGITLPLRQLTDRARSLAAGSSNERVEVGTSDEIADLASTFNYMADEMAQRKRNLLATLDELRHSRLMIMQERNFQSSILESISSAIVTFSPEGLLTSINGTGLKFLGNDKVINMHYREVFECWGDMADRIETVLITHTGYRREPFVIDRGAGTVYFEIGFFPIGNDAEKGITVTMRNETEKEKLREEMIRLDRLASLGKLSAGIAHEVRNPLTGISLLLDDLHDRTTSHSGDQIMIKKALAEIERVERLINALLNYSSPARAEFMDCNLDLLVNDICLLMRRQCERQKVQLNCISGGIPTFRFDPDKIKQALLNITKNALEALADGGIITIETSISGNQAVVAIKDDGPGIKESDLPLIFEPFFTRKGAGTGLGLSITQRIIEEHKGRIFVDSKAGVGTTFKIELPL